mgnify:CR=1 FL=1
MVLITGATGFVGYYAVKEFAEHGYDIIATDLPSCDFSEVEKFCKVIPCNLVKDDLSVLFKGVDTVIHIAGLFDLTAPYEKLFDVNVKATGRICAQAVGKVKRFIMVSSTGVYGLPSNIPCKEEDPKNPRNSYEKTKYLGERLSLDFFYLYKLPVVVIRPTLIYGPRSRYGHAIYIGLFALACARGQRRFPNLKNGPFTHSVHVEDVARAILFLAEKKGIEGEIYNVADDSPITAEEFLKSIANAVGVKMSGLITYPVARVFTTLLSHLPIYDKLKSSVLKLWDSEMEKRKLNPILKPKIDQPWRDYFAGHFVYDTTKIKSLGFSLKFPDFPEGIQETAKWYRDNGWIP